jgi:hypothetical protein
MSLSRKSFDCVRLAPHFAQDDKLLPPWLCKDLRFSSTYFFPLLMPAHFSSKPSVAA